MFITALIAAGLAAAIHVYIFVLESLRWTHPSTQRVFGIRSDDDAQTTKALAFNQGFYNLFIALLVVVGIVVALAGSQTVGLTLLIAGCGIMLAAALVLVISNYRMLRPATIQGLLPLVAVVTAALAA